MKQYKIFTTPYGMTEAVKQGWSWPAFFFNSIWALVKRLWVIGALTLPVMVFLWFSSAVAANMPGESGQIVAQIVSLTWIIFKVIFGAFGNTWREINLVAKGFAHVATVSASNPADAAGMHVAPLADAAQRVSVKAAVPAAPSAVHNPPPLPAHGPSAYFAETAAVASTGVQASVQSPTTGVTNWYASLPNKKRLIILGVALALSAIPFVGWAFIAPWLVPWMVYLEYHRP